MFALDALFGTVLGAGILAPVTVPLFIGVDAIRLRRNQLSEAFLGPVCQDVYGYKDCSQAGFVLGGLERDGFSGPATREGYLFYPKGNYTALETTVWRAPSPSYTETADAQTVRCAWR